jgi:hypothetical protein
MLKSLGVAFAVAAACGLLFLLIGWFWRIGGPIEADRRNIGYVMQRYGAALAWAGRRIFVVSLLALAVVLAIAATT